MKRQLYRLFSSIFLFGLLITQSPLQMAQATGGYKDKVAVLMYHHVDNINKLSLTITPVLFREQLILLKNKGYHFITLHDFHLFLQGGSVPDNAVLITFDDGYESFYTQAYPILKEFSIPAVNFIVTNYLIHQSPYLPHLSMQQMHAMYTKQPSIDFQCHTHNMHMKVGRKSYLTAKLMGANGKENQEEYEKRVIKDTSTCVYLLKKSGVSNPDFFSYPYGIHNDLSDILLLESGIKYAFVIHPGLVMRGSNHLAIPRINAGTNSVSPEKLYRTINHLSEMGS